VGSVFLLPTSPDMVGKKNTLPTLHDTKGYENCRFDPHLSSLAFQIQENPSHRNEPPQLKFGAMKRMIP
jgi:hypothetical protein